MSIARRDDGQWRARYRDDSRKEHAKQFTRKIDAERWLRAQKSQLDRGDWTDPTLGTMTVGEWAGRWLPGRPLKPKTMESYRSLLRTQVVPRWKDVALARVTYGEAAGWVGAMTAAGLSPSRVRQAAGLLSHMLDDAVKDGRIARNVVKGVDLPRLPERMHRRRLSPDQVEELADECGPYRLLALVLAYSGLRIGEVAALRVGDVNPLRRRLEVAESLAEVGGKLIFGPTKSHQRRSVPLPSFVLDEVLPALAGRDPGALLFTSPEGEPIRYPNFRRRVWDPARSRAGLDWLTPHGLRHYAVSVAIANGANALDVAAMVGHKDPSVTMRVYADLFDDGLDAVAERMNAVGAKARADRLRTKGQSRIIPAIFGEGKMASDLR